MVTLIAHHNYNGTNAGNLDLKYLIGYFLFFAGLGFSWTITYKRQIDSNKLKRRAMQYAFMTSFSVLIASEFLAWNFQESREFQIWWLVSGGIGSLFGIWAFCGVYRRCY